MALFLLSAPRKNGWEMTARQSVSLDLGQKIHLCAVQSLEPLAPSAVRPSGCTVSHTRLSGTQTTPKRVLEGLNAESSGSASRLHVLVATTHELRWSWQQQHWTDAPAPACTRHAARDRATDRRLSGGARGGRQTRNHIGPSPNSSVLNRHRFCHAANQTPSIL